MAEFKFDFTKYCKGCSWCCKGESPYASEKELKQYGLKAIKESKEEPCNLLENELCSKYSQRPFDCRIFPVDLKEINGKINWILWLNCPASSHLDIEKFLGWIEKELSKEYSFQHLINHIKHDKKNLPEKYSSVKFKVLREVRWPEKI